MNPTLLLETSRYTNHVYLSSSRYTFIESEDPTTSYHLEVSQWVPLERPLSRRSLLSFIDFADICSHLLMIMPLVPILLICFLTAFHDANISIREITPLLQRFLDRLSCIFYVDVPRHTVDPGLCLTIPLGSLIFDLLALFVCLLLTIGSIIAVT